MLNIETNKKILASQKGLSLVEILIALTLLAIAGTFVVGSVLDNLREGEIKSAKIQIKNISGILTDYKRKCGTYPTEDALIAAPTTGRECKRYPPNGFIQGGKIPEDPWGYEFIYKSNGRDFEIISTGPDGMEGGEGEDADISSKDI